MSDQFDDIFGEPALLQGEDKDRYLRLYAMIEADKQPKDFFDRIQVREEADKIWEELRIRRCSAALIDSTHIQALAQLLEPLQKRHVFLKNCSEVAFEYYGTDLKAKQKVAAMMAQYGITETMIHAKAMQIQGGTLQYLDRMITSREIGRRNLRKEQEKRAARGYARTAADLEKSA
jgi:hypothetical protein